jgi:phosphoglycolate phosphatase
MNKKVIIFDMDGVLFDSQKSSDDYFLGKFPTMTRNDMMEILCGNFYEEYEKIKQYHKPISETDQEKESRIKIYHEAKEKSDLFPGIKDLIEKLHQTGNILAINSSANEKNCNVLLEKNGIKGCFDFIGVAEVSKSKVEKFKMIEEKYGVSKNNILFVTDTLGDIREADKAGINTIAVTWGAHNTSYFMREPHKNLVKIIDTVADLRSFITGC